MLSLCFLLFLPTDITFSERLMTCASHLPLTLQRDSSLCCLRWLSAAAVGGGV